MSNLQVNEDDQDGKDKEAIREQVRNKIYFFKSNRIVDLKCND